MKSFGIVLTLISSLLFICFWTFIAVLEFRYTNEIHSNWKLADKSSTIEEKSRYIDRYVITLEQQGFEGKYNALFLKTPNNSFDLNLKALKSLQLRLREISNMDVSSFEYQTAIQQITQQEQGEASEMLSVLKGVYFLNNGILVWGWIGIVVFVVLAILIIVGILMWNSY